MGKRTIQEIEEVEESERVVVCDFCEDEEDNIHSFNEVAFDPMPKNGLLCEGSEVSEDGTVIQLNGFSPQMAFYVMSEDERHLDDSCYAAFKEGL